MNFKEPSSFLAASTYSSFRAYSNGPSAWEPNYPDDCLARILADSDANGLAKFSVDARAVHCSGERGPMGRANLFACEQGDEA